MSELALEAKLGLALVHPLLLMRDVTRRPKSRSSSKPPAPLSVTAGPTSADSAAAAAVGVWESDSEDDDDEAAAVGGLASSQQPSLSSDDYGWVNDVLSRGERLFDCFQCACLSGFCAFIK